jgi:steroid delta-isomerase-like uncharacterized protein
MEHSQIESILRAWQAAWGEGDVDDFEKILAPGYVRHTHAHDKDVTALRQEIADSRAAFPDLKTEILVSVEQGDMVALRWRSYGTHTGSFMSVPPTGRKVEVVGASFCRFVDGLLAEEWVVWDPRELLSAMKIFSVPTANSSH